MKTVNLPLRNVVVAVLGGLNDADAAGVFFSFKKPTDVILTKLLKAPVHFTKKKLSPVKKIKTRYIYTWFFSPTKKMLLEFGRWLSMKFS